MRNRLRLLTLALLALAVTACQSLPGAAIRKADPKMPLQVFYAAQSEYTIALRTFVATVDGPIALDPRVAQAITDVNNFDKQHVRPFIIAVNEAVLVSQAEDGSVSPEYVDRLLFELGQMVDPGSPERAAFDALLAAIRARRAPDVGTLDVVNSLLVSAETYVRNRIAVANRVGLEASR